MEDHLKNELDRAERKGVVSETTKDPRQAFQFPRKREAIEWAKRCAWGATAPLRVSVMGFWVWVISDSHLNYLTARGALRWINGEPKHEA